MALKQKSIVIMAGGTGGHVFPALAVADVLKAQGCLVTWLGTADRMEAQTVPAAGYAIDFIPISAIRGKGLGRWLRLPFTLIRAIWQAGSILKHRQPDVVLGMGGFAAGPGGIAAKLLGIPLCIHEQNAVPGMTNRWLAKVANQVLCGFSGAFPNAQVVGNPVRIALVKAAAKSKPRPQARDLHVLVLGGSQGAKVLNDTVPAAVKQVASEDLHVWHQSGEATYAQAEAGYKACANIQLTRFIDDMSEAYQWADVVIARAGALTVTELMLFQKPALLVPLPYATDDHQSINARALVRLGLAECIRQDQFSADVLAGKLSAWLKDRSLLNINHQHGLEPNHAGAAEAVAAVCLAAAKLE